MKYTNILYRDDDVNVYTDAFEFKKLHQQFIDKNQVHTVAVIMKDLWENHALFWYLATAPLLQVELHGWEHKDYSLLSYEECYSDIQKSLTYWETNYTRMVYPNNKGITVYKSITTFFAPWNKESENIKQACADLGLRFCNVKGGIWEKNKIKSFHWWNIIDGWKL